MNNNETIIAAASALNSTDAIVLRQIFRSMLSETNALRSELNSLKSLIADMKKPGDR